MAKALTCQSCQQWILRSFIASVGGIAPIASPQRRTFSRTLKRREDNKITKAPGSEEDDHSLDSIYDSVDEHLDLPSQSTYKPSHPQPPPLSQLETDASLPWYLRHNQQQTQDTQQLQSSPFRQREEELPDLPPNPPDLLTPLLTQISTTLGLTNLTLLDLRTLENPPPALGSNLLMLIATARSEKHLHVSADRLCRWLRTEWKLRPFADGLLGRQEMKVRLRRKVKRGKLMGTSFGVKGTGLIGAEDEGQVDDGIRTGWVCVNIGPVEGGALEMEGKEKEREFVGFGPERSEFCNLVVQILTEEKREEVGLERLWGDLLKKQRVRSEVEEDGTEAFEHDVVEGGEGSHTEEGVAAYSPATSAPRYGFANQASNANGGQQLRAYHTAGRRLQATQMADTSIEHIPAPVAATTIPRRDLAARSADASLTTLDKLFASLKSLPRRQALETLGPNLLHASSHLSLTASEPEYLTAQTSLVPANTSSPPAPALDPISPFLTTFYASFPPFPTSAHWHTHIALLTHARALGHQEIHSTVLEAQVENMQISGLVPEERTFLLVLEGMLTGIGRGAGEGNYDGVKSFMSEGKIERVLRLLEGMKCCGYDPVQPRVLTLLQRASAGSNASLASSTAISNSSKATALHDLLPGLHLSRLRRHIHNSDSQAFWRAWRGFPQRFQARTRDMYVLLFNALADGTLPLPLPEGRPGSVSGWGSSALGLGSKSLALNLKVGVRGAKTFEVEQAGLLRMVLSRSLEELEMEVGGLRGGDLELARAVKGAIERVFPRAGDSGLGIKTWLARCEEVLSRGG